jgi:DTW domain-containing protein YfiP
MRGQRLSRCRICGIPPRFCVCANIVPEAVCTRVVIVMHHTERHRSTNTARLLAHALQGAEIRVRGLRDAPRPQARAVGTPQTPNASGAPARRLLLFPRTGARPLTGDDRGAVLFVPDGSWPQAQRIARRDPAMCDAEPVTLPGAPTSRFDMRKAPHPGRLSTFEAVAEALGIVEGPEVRVRLLALFEYFVERARGVREGRYR